MKTRQVPIGRSHRAVPELTRNEQDWPAFVRQLGRVSVPQTMSVDSVLYPGSLAQALNDVANGPRAHRPSLHRAEERTLPDPAIGPSRDPDGHTVHGAGIYANGPGFAPLAVQHAHRAAGRVNIGDPECQDFGTPQTCPPHHRQKSPVPLSRISVLSASQEQRPDFRS